MPLICPTCQIVFAGIAQSIHASDRHATLHGVVFDILVGSQSRVGPTFPDHASSGNRASSLQLDIIVPVIMSCALLWWVNRGMSWTTRLAVTVVTLVLILCIVLFERSGFWSSLSP